MKNLKINSLKKILFPRNAPGKSWSCDVEKRGKKQNCKVVRRDRDLVNKKKYN